MCCDCLFICEWSHCWITFTPWLWLLYYPYPRPSYSPVVTRWHCSLPPGLPMCGQRFWFWLADCVTLDCPLPVAQPSLCCTGFVTFIVRWLQLIWRCDSLQPCWRLPCDLTFTLRCWLLWRYVGLTQRLDCAHTHAALTHTALRCCTPLPHTLLLLLDSMLLLVIVVILAFVRLGTLPLLLVTFPLLALYPWIVLLHCACYPCTFTLPC